MDRFDVAVIGAGPEGLIAAITLGRAGLRVVLLEKASEPGGRATTHEFHPGFRASPYADELPAVPDRLFRFLELARHGVILVPSPASVCISREGTSIIFADETRLARSVLAASLPGILSFRRDVAALQHDIEHRLSLRPEPRRRRWFRRSRPPVGAGPWPGGSWAGASLDDVLRAHIPDPQLRLHFAADAISGRAVSPFLAGTSLHALAPGTGRSGQPPGGLGRLTNALVRAAEASGVAIRCGAEVTEIQVRGGRAASLVVAGHGEIGAAAILSALDLKRTFLSLLPRNVLPEAIGKRAGRVRMAGARGRVLFALDAPPNLPFACEAQDAASGPIHVAESMQALSAAHDVWRTGAIPHAPLVTLRLPSVADPRYAPMGKAVMTATLSSIPAKLSNGGWTAEKREKLVMIALAAAERAMPGVRALVVGHHIIAGPDIEKALGSTEGDYEGGEIAPDQALGFRPFHDADWQDGRTPVPGLYFGGPSSAASPFFLGLSGERAALAATEDLQSGQLR